MSLRSLLRPYAAKAIIEHEFVGSYLTIWLTFRFSMDTTKQPALNLWDIKVDSVVCSCVFAGWEDAWTIRLLALSISAPPRRVTVAYGGPSTNLTTTWNKQWEPWGPILSSDIT